MRKAHDELDAAPDPATRATPRARLVELVGVDHGDDPRVWHEALRLMLRADTTTALDELGVLDDGVRAWMEAERIGFYSLSLDREIRNTIMNGHVRTVWLPEDLDYYGTVEEPKMLYFLHNAHRTTGGRATATPVANGIEVSLDDVRATLAGSGRPLREAAFALLVRWAEAHGGGRRFVIDDHWHAWLVNEAQLAAIRSYKATKLRVVDVASVERATAWLADAGIALPPAQDLPDGTTAEIIVAMLFSTRSGVVVETDDPAVVWRALQSLPAEVRVGLAKEPPADLEPTSTGEIVNCINTELSLAGSPMRLVGVARGNETMVLFVPVDRVASLAEAGILTHGASAAERAATRIVATFTPPVVTPITPTTIVPVDRQWVGDGESVDSPSNYEDVVHELCGLAKFGPIAFRAPRPAACVTCR